MSDSSQAMGMSSFDGSNGFYVKCEEKSLWLWIIFFYESLCQIAKDT